MESRNGKSRINLREEDEIERLHAFSADRIIGICNTVGNSAQKSLLNIGQTDK